MHDRSWCDPDEVKMDPDCMLSPPEGDRSGRGGRSCQHRKVLDEGHPIQYGLCTKKIFVLPLALCNGTASGE